MGELREDQVGRRIWGRDVSLWTRDEGAVKEAKKRLGWLTLPQDTTSELEFYRKLRDEILEEGIDQVLWLGMGGSSLAADVLSRLFPYSGGLKLRVLDSTDPDEVAEASAWAEPARTLFVTASKIGYDCRAAGHAGPVLGVCW